MFGRSSATIGLLTALATPSAAWAQAPGAEPLVIATAIAKAVLILLGALIGLSVVAKLSIVFGIVPREPATAFHTLVHRAANFVGRLRPSRSIRDQRRASRLPDDRRP